MKQSLILTLIAVLTAPQWFPYLVAQEPQSSAHRLPAEPLAHLQAMLLNRFPEGTTSENDGKKFEFRWHCHDYLIHPPADRLAESFRDSERVSGPGDDGFQLYLEWRTDYDDSGSGQLETFGYLEPREYWRIYKNVYRLPEKQGVIWMKFDAGRTMDEKVLKEIRKELEIVGRPKADADPRELSADTDWWSNYTASLRTKLTQVMLKHQIPIAWKQLENGDYVFEVKPKIYDVHEVSDEGVVSPKSHKVTGPDSNGVIVKLTYITPKPVDCQPQAKYGKIQHWYWTRYFETRDDFPTVRFEMLYGKSTDRKLLNEIVDTFHTLSDAPSRF